MIDANALSSTRCCAAWRRHADRKGDKRNENRGHGGTGHEWLLEGIAIDLPVGVISPEGGRRRTPSPYAIARFTLARRSPLMEYPRTSMPFEGQSSIYSLDRDRAGHLWRTRCHARGRIDHPQVIDAADSRTDLALRFRLEGRAPADDPGSLRIDDFTDAPTHSPSNPEHQVSRNKQTCQFPFVPDVSSSSKV